LICKARGSASAFSMPAESGNEENRPEFLAMMCQYDAHLSYERYAKPS
jgi:hypothetical protein